MKRTTFIAILMVSAALLFLTTACQRTDDIHPATQDAFRGLYSPGATVVQIRYDLDEGGVEAHMDSLTYFDRWNWTPSRQLSDVEFDPAGAYYANPIQDVYYYNVNGRLDSIGHFIGGESNIPVRTFHFTYSGGLLSQIGFRTYTTDFLYHDGQQYPYAIVFTHPLQDWMINTYGTDTLIQQWTLEWRDGNLIRATADSMAWYCTGLSKIEYAYDNHPNPFQGYFNSSLINRDGFIDDPSCLCQNNLVRRTDYHYDNRDGSTTTTQTDWSYQYSPNGYPSSVTTSYPTMYWTTITVKSTFFYDNPWLEE